MKGTIDLVIKIDGAKVETIFSMRDGVEDMDIDVIDKVTKAATSFASSLKRRICRESPHPKKYPKTCTKSKICAGN